MDDFLPFDEPTDTRKRRMPGRPPSKSKPIDAAAFGLHPKQPAAADAPRCIDDIPERFRKPSKPPVGRML